MGIPTTRPAAISVAVVAISSGLVRVTGGVIMALLFPTSLCAQTTARRRSRRPKPATEGHITRPCATSCWRFVFCGSKGNRSQNFLQRDDGPARTRGYVRVGRLFPGTRPWRQFQRRCAGTSLSFAVSAAISSCEYRVCRLVVLAGSSSRPLPGRWASLGRMALLTSSPPQFGHTFMRTRSAQSAHHVHSYVQIRAS